MVIEMLSVEESGFLFKFMSICSSAYLFPFVVDRRSGKLVKFSRRKHLIWMLIYVFVLTHYIHGLSQLALVLTVRQDEIVLFHLPPQFDGVIAPLFLHPVVIITYHFHGDMLVKVFNELFDSSNERKIKRPLWKLSIQELLSFGILIIACGALPLYIIMVIFMQDMAHLLINNSWLDSVRTSTTFVVVTTLLEAWCTAIWLFNTAFLLSLNCLVPSRMDFLLEAIHTPLRYVRWKFRVAKLCDKNAWSQFDRLILRGRGTAATGINLRESCIVARRVQLYVQFYNKVNCWFLHAMKMLCIAATILHGYVGIRFGQKDLLVAVFCAFVHTAAFIVYCGIFQSAYRPSNLQRIVKQELISACGTRTNPLVRKELLKMAQALQCPGIQVGKFHEMERNSALIFIDFVERQLMSLLVAFWSLAVSETPFRIRWLNSCHTKVSILLE